MSTSYRPWHDRLKKGISFLVVISGALLVFPLVSASASPSAGVERLDEVNRRAPIDQMIDADEQSILRKVLWYLPNRIVDFVDIFRVDVGVGSSAGAVLRLSRYGQMGGRVVDPLSVRVGVRGREFPMFFERQSEYGFCSAFQQTPARNITPLEVGIGLDLGIGAYLGFSFDELADFFLGFVLIDFKHDDLVPMLEPHTSK